MSDQLQIRDTSSLYFLLGIQAGGAIRPGRLFLATQHCGRRVARFPRGRSHICLLSCHYSGGPWQMGKWANGQMVGKWATHITFVTIGILCNALIFGLLSSYLYFSPSVFLFLALVFVSYSLVPIATSWVYLLSLYVVGLALGFITQVDQGMSILRWVPADSVPVFLTVALAILGIRFLRVRDSAQ